jgi:hypothetical protein
MADETTDTKDKGLVGVRASTSWLLILVTGVLYYLDKAEAASAFGTLATMAVTWMFRDRTEGDTKK